MNSYDLSRNFINFAFENPSKIKPNHYALYFFAIEHCNRLGWKKEYGLPTTMTMEAIGIKSYNTYSNTFNDLVEFGFFKLIEKSKNQYSANIIALSNFNKAQYEALDNAFIKHDTKHCSITDESIDSIDKPITNNKEQKKSFEERKKSFIEWFNNEKLKYTGVKGRARVLTSSDENNLKRLFKEYDFEDFKKAIPALYQSQWAKENNMQTISHFLRVENFNKYLEYKEPTKKKAYDI